MFDILRFCKDYNIDQTTQHHHSSKGWVQIRECPYCKSDNYHLGMNPKKKSFSCWHCGGHKFFDTLELLAGLSRGQLMPVVYSYETDFLPSSLTDEIRKAKFITIPDHVGKITDRHKTYLLQRFFDPDEIEFVYGILGSSHLADDMWKNRIIVPIMSKGKLVNLQGRDITKQKKLRYYSLPNEESVMDLKDTLYGFDNVPGSKIIVVEGVTDVWRLGMGAVATYGTKFTHAQLKMMLSFDEVYVYFDNNDIYAQEMADILYKTLLGFGKKTGVIRDAEHKGDPADLTSNQARMLMKEWRIV